MIKHVHRILVLVATLLLALAAAVAVSAAPSSAETPTATEAPAATTPADTTTTTAPPDTGTPETTQPTMPVETTTTAPTTTQPETTQPTTTEPTTTTPPTTTPKQDTGTVTVIAMDLKTRTEVAGVEAELSIDGVHDRMVTTPSTSTVRAGWVYVALMDQPPAGYDWMKAVPQSFQLAPGQHVTVTIELGRPELRGSVTITKRDRITGALLAGAQYWIASCRDGSVGAGLTTGANGVGTQWLHQGCYRVQETVAPAGYELDPTVYTVTVEPTHNEYLTLFDTPKAPVVVVRDPGTRVPLRSIPTGRTS
ncbi:MSCRAMM family protein [Gordonia phthalatica]|uniref:MSCRAMM family protein n=1 Tax=Gordonia phthalatica TaxID=1136941 RepID=UPI0007818521|nr:SpaA isopeptide-forming pilin-related protein [Gordonia phthalatica]